ncbi:MAG: BamA/TamA family outer membrane protein [Bacteroidota bacterium]
MRRFCTAAWWLGGLLIGGLLLPAPAHAQYFRFGKNKVQYAAHDWHYVQSEHFNVYYYEGGKALADFTAEAAEDAYADLQRLFRYNIGDRIPLIVYLSHNDFVVTNAVNLPTYSEGIGGVTELFKNRIAIPFNGDYRDYRRVVHHELVHAVINDMFYGGSFQSLIQNNIQLRIPHWFNEGLAEYASEGWSSDADDWVRDATLNASLDQIERLQGFASYQAGQSVWDYIAAQYGPPKVGEILQRIRQTRNVEMGFQRTTGLNLEQLSAQWTKALREVHYPEVAAREELAEIAKPLITEKQGFYNTSPALSPKGDRMAYITTRGALFDVYLASTSDGTTIRKLVDAQTTTAFESLRILSPGLSWSPDGVHLAVAVKSGPHDAIAVVNTETTEAQHYIVPEVDQILSVAWSPDSSRIAFSGTMNAQSDIFVLDLETHESVNYTNDVFSDHEPAWSPDGTRIAFHSDRGRYTLLSHHTLPDLLDLNHDYSQFDVYEMTPGIPYLDRLTVTDGADERSARYGPDGDRMLFISDRNGVFNLYERQLPTGTTRPLTDLLVGTTQVSLSADGQRAALVSLVDGTPSIFLLREPFERDLGLAPLTPNVWQQRRSAATDTLPPALVLARAQRQDSNPFLRDATDLTPLSAATDRLAEAQREGLNQRFLDNLTAQANPPDDSTAYGVVRVDFRNYVFDEEVAVPDAEPLAGLDLYDPFDVRDNRNADGSYRGRKYKLSFSPDLVYGSAGFDALYGAQSVTQMLFSDMLGNHQIFVATNLLLDLRTSDYVFAYSFLPRRVDWSLSSFHIARLLPDFERLTYYRYRQYGGRLSVTYPLDKFRRIEADVSIVGVNQADITDASIPAVSRTLFNPSVSFTKDATTPGVLYPRHGRRYALRVSGTPFSFDARGIRFVTLLGDTRTYRSFGQDRYTLALRFSGGLSLGPTPQLFYTSGVQNWLNRDIDPNNGFPISEASDFLFATPIMPLRGYALNALNGTQFGLVNAEFRFPLIAAVLPGPLPIFPLYNIEGTAFMDIGAVWGGRGQASNPFNAFRTTEEDERVFDDMLAGAGFGIRSVFLGYPIRLDFAWPHNGQRFGSRRTYLSIGLDF